MRVSDGGFMGRIGLGLLLAGCFGLPLMAQDKPSDYHSGAALESQQKRMMAAAAGSPTGAANLRLADYGDHALTMAARVKSGGPEVHEHWTDVLIVTEGQATLVIGGTVVNPVVRGVAGSGEMGGSDITGGTVQVVKKGDVINIPAGTPHWIKIAPGDTFAYMNVKVKKV
jgi:mannose-6-phosphate isomerase-like protein (cupin superfamily)